MVSIRKAFSNRYVKLLLLLSFAVCLAISGFAKELKPPVVFSEEPNHYRMKIAGRLALIDKNTFALNISEGKYNLTLSYKEIGKGLTVANKVTKMARYSFGNKELRAFSFYDYELKTRQVEDPETGKLIDENYWVRKGLFPKEWNVDLPQRDGIEYALILNEYSGRIFRFKVDYSNLLYEVKEDEINFYPVPEDGMIDFGVKFSIKKPIFINANGNKVEAEMSFDGESLVVRAPVGWLENASYPVVLDPEISFGSSTTFNSGTTYLPAIATLDSTHFVIAYRDNGNSSYGTAVIGTVSGDSISFGGEYVFNAGNTDDSIDVATLDSTHFVVVYNDVDTYGSAIIGVVSGSSISYGSEYHFSSSNPKYIRVTALDPTHFVVSSNGSVAVGTVSGTDISFGSFSSCGGATTHTALATLDSSHIVAVYGNTAYIGTVSGDTITCGSGYSFDSDIWYPAVATLDPTHFVIAYRDNGNSSYGTAVIGTVSGDSISFGGEYVYNPATTNANSIATLDSTHFVIAYEDHSNSLRGTAVIGTVSGNSISFSSEYVYEAGGAEYMDITTLDSIKIVIGYQYYPNKYGNAVVGTAVLNTPPTIALNSPNGNQYLFGTVSIDFNIQDTDNDELHVKIAYSTTRGAFENTIASDLNLNNHTNIANLTCDDTDWTDSTNCTYSWDTTSISDGNYYIDINVWDTSNADATDSSDSSFMIDNTAPTTTASAGSYTFNTWTNQDVTISLSCDDGSGSGCDKTYYCTDTSNSCTPTTEYSSSFTITAEGTTYVRFYSKDRAGNNESVSYKIVKIDKTAPSTTDDAPTGWQASDVTITLTPSDSGSGVHDTNYCVDTDNTCTPNISGTSVDVTCSAGSTCQKYVRYRSVDRAGNVETTNSVLVQIDKEAPSVGTTTLSGFSTYGSYIKGTGTIVGGTATDSGSGIDTTTCEYTADNGTTWNAGTWNTDHCEKTNFTISDGVTYTFNTRVKDNVANLGTGTATSSYTGDLTPPTNTNITINDSSGYTADNTPSLSLSATDSGSGVKEMAFSCDNSNWSSWVTYSTSYSSFNIETGAGCSVGDGSKTIYVKFRDNLDNESTSVSDSTYLDTTPPTTTHDAPSTWQANDVVVTLTCNDGSGSGCANTYYCIDDSNTCTPTTTGTSVNVTCASGSVCQKYVRFYSEDNLGNTETTTATNLIKIDKQAPTTTDDAPSGWQTAPFSFTLTPSDGSGSGVSSTAFRIDGGDWNANTTVWITTDGNHQVDYNSTDNVGNVESTHTIWVALDTVAPTTTDDHNAGWQKIDQNVHLTCSDTTSGCDIIQYRIDGGSWQTYNPATGILFTTDGNFQLDYNAKDVAGNIETTKTVWIAVDKTPPTTTDNAPSGWQTSDVTVTLTPSDATSGVANTYYRVDSGSWQTGTSIDITTDGNHQIDYYSVDNASNTETTKATWVAVDKTAPTTSHDAPSGWQNTDINIHLTCSDATSGCNITQYRIDSGAWTTYDTNILISTDGNHQIDFNSTDIAGNVETTNTIWVARDTVKPTIIDFNIHEDKIGTNEAKPDLNITATDDRSGMYQMRFSCDNSNWTSWINYANQYSDFNFLDPTYGCTASEGIKTVYIQVSDKAGNYSLTTSDDINYDVTPPTIDNNRLSATEIQTGESVTIYVDVSDNLTGVNTVKYYILYPTGDTYIWSMDLNDGNTYVATFGDTSISGYYQIYKFEAMDNVNTGNIGTLDTVLKFNVVEPGTGGEGGGGEAGGGGGSGGTVLLKEVAVADLNFKPSAIDHYFIYNCVIPFFCKLDLTKADKKQLYTAVILSSKELKKCESGKPNFTCELKDSSTAVIKLEYQANNKLSEILETRIALTDTDDQINYVPVRVRVINLGFYIPLRTPIQLPDSLKGILSDPAWFALDEQGRIIGIRVWWMPIILIVIVLLVWKLKR